MGCAWGIFSTTIERNASFSLEVGMLKNVNVNGPNRIGSRRPLRIRRRETVLEAPRKEPTRSATLRGRPLPVGATIQNGSQVQTAGS